MSVFSFINEGSKPTEQLDKRHEHKSSSFVRGELRLPAGLGRSGKLRRIRRGKDKTGRAGTGRRRPSGIGIGTQGARHPTRPRESASAGVIGRGQSSRSGYAVL